MEFYLGYVICSIAILLAVIIAMIAQVKVNGAFNKYKETLSSLDLTGEELAEKLSFENGVGVNIKLCNGTLTDHYDPKDKSINISQSNFYSKSIASQAIVAHEFGHALQDAEDYFPYKVRQGVVKASNIISKLLLPMILIGLLFELFFFAGVGNIIIYVYVGIYSIAVITNLVTLPVEYNASSRAKKLLYQMGCNTNEEVQATDQLLNAAAMTYVASLLVSVAYLARILFILFASRRD